MTLRPPFTSFGALALLVLASCGGSGPPEQAAWSAAVEVTTLAGRQQPVEIRPEPSGGLSVSWRGGAGGQAEWGWLRRAGNGSWTAVPSLPVQMRDAVGSTYVVAWTADAFGPRGVMVFDDGYRPDEATFTDTDPRDEHLEPIERSGAGWSVLPDIPLPGNRALHCQYDTDSSAEALCIASRPNGINSVPVMLRYRPATGWQLGEDLDLSADPGNYIALRELVRDAAGRALAVWERGPSGAGVPFHTAFHTYDPLTGWGALGTIPGVEPYRMGGAAALGDGTFMLGHVVCTSGGSGRTCAPAASRYLPATGWQAPSELGARLSIQQVYAPGLGYHDSPYVTPPRLFSSAAGHVLALWSVDDERWSRFYSPAGGWTAPARVDAIVPTTAGFRAIGIDVEGVVTAGSDTGIYRFDASSGWRKVAQPLWPQGAAVAMSVDLHGAVAAVWTVEQPSTQDAGKTTFFSARFQ